MFSDKKRWFSYSFFLWFFIVECRFVYPVFFDTRVGENLVVYTSSFWSKGETGSTSPWDVWGEDDPPVSSDTPLNPSSRGSLYSLGWGETSTVVSRVPLGPECGSTTPWFRRRGGGKSPQSPPDHLSGLRGATGVFPLRWRWGRDTTVTFDTSFVILP